MSSPIQQPPRRHTYSVDDYYRMAETGILRAEDRAGMDNNSFTLHREPQATEYAQVLTLESLARIDVPGLVGMTVASSGS